jgi:hypothetical protein
MNAHVSSIVEIMDNRYLKKMSLFSLSIKVKMASNLYKAGFRRLLKSAHVAFAKDQYAIRMARAQLREEFYKNRNVKDSSALVQLAKDVDDIEEMLRFNIVQGSLNQKGNFCKLKPSYVTLIFTLFCSGRFQGRTLYHSRTRPGKSSWS